MYVNIDPDYLSTDLVFIYDGLELYHSASFLTHYEFLAYLGFDVSTETKLRAVQYEQVHGRIGQFRGDNYVAFWNTNIGERDYLRYVLIKLLQKKLINGETLVAQPDDTSFPQVNTIIRNKWKGGRVEQERLRKLEARRRLHTMTGIAKQFLMHYVGVGATKGNNKWRAAAFKHRLYLSYGD